MFATRILLKRSQPFAVNSLRAAQPAAMVPMPRFFFSAAPFKPSPKLVKELRNITGSPLKDCLSVLAETSGDIQASKDLLRKKGLAFAEKRADRDATEGLVGIMEDESSVTMVQFACETDFVAKTDRFRDALSTILKTVHG